MKIKSFILPFLRLLATRYLQEILFRAFAAKKSSSKLPSRS
jgi:hypothetical protein